MTEGRPPKVLIVDDDEAIADYLVARLDRCGCRSDWAEDGEMGLWKARTSAPDLILLDLAMPVLDGFGFLNQKRLVARIKATPVVVMSARHLEADVKRAVALGAHDYLAKPIEDAALMRRLARRMPAGLRFDHHAA